MLVCTHCLATRLARKCVAFCHPFSLDTMYLYMTRLVLFADMMFHLVILNEFVYIQFMCSVTVSIWSMPSHIQIAILLFAYS